MALALGDDLVDSGLDLVHVGRERPVRSVKRLESSFLQRLFNKNKAGSSWRN
jgi:hypothetical protein